MKLERKVKEAKALQKVREKEICERKNLTKDVERLQDEVMKGI